MPSLPNFDCWGIVIDTDAYAGNFERAMCAHITGAVGECGVGEEFADKRLDETEYDDDENATEIVHVPDEHGCSRPCSIFQSTDGEYNSVVIYFSTKPTEEQINIVKERAATFIEKWHEVYEDKTFMELHMKKILGFRLVKFELIQTITAL